MCLQFPFNKVPRLCSVFANGVDDGGGKSIWKTSCLLSNGLLGGHVANCEYMISPIYRELSLCIETVLAQRDLLCYAPHYVGRDIEAAG